MKKGFTIVETLVAITVLMIAIAGPLVIASKGLTSAIYSKDQMIATFLAQESMEVIKNRRDNNIGGSPPASTWLFGFSDSCYGDTSRCGASALDPDPFINSGCSGLSPDGCRIYQNSDGYSHDPNNAYRTIFSRYYYLVSKKTSPPEEVQVNVIVNWYEGTIPYQIKLTSELVNTIR